MCNYLDDLNHVKTLINKGKIVLCPTDTIWGLSCDALNQEAVRRIYEIKNRDLDKPLILLVDSIAHLKKWVKDVHPRVETLIHYHLRPISVVYEASQKLPDFLCNADNTVAIRVTKNQMLKKLIAHLGKPIVSTSANLQGAPSPTNFVDISTEVINNVDYVFETHRDSANKSKSSRLIRWDQEGELIFLR